jgi:acetyl/propionyl-CoA carboxylase alpha subunit
MPSLRKDKAADILPFGSVLIANRGEIAVRIIRACRELGLEAIAVYSDADAQAGHVRLADRAVRLGPANPGESYLNIEAVVGAAIATGAGAVHPGYGFLAERASFARAVNAAGMRFVGPAPDALEALGDKLHARHLARAAGVPIVPGTLEPAAIERPDQLEPLAAEADEIGYPLMVKAAAGGGGRGMRRVTRREDLAVALLDGSHEAASAFGDGRVYLEREIWPARHIEVQLLGDDRGTVVAIGERDCSLQRRHQKLVEEAPAPGLRADERKRLHGLAVAVASAARLTNAATAEFLRAEEGSFHFLEVNTRLQVEHGVTELVTGLDIVREQLRLAGGLPLSPGALEAAARAADPFGHAIEVRISAEDPGNQFAPSPGPVRHWVMPAGPGIRVDTAIEPGDEVPSQYDNLIAKLMVHAADRDTAIARLERALRETEVGGIQTTLPFHRFVAGHEGFRKAQLSTGWVEANWRGAAEQAAAARPAALAAALAVAAGEGTGDAAPAPSTTGVSAQRHDRRAWSQDALETGVDRWPV